MNRTMWAAMAMVALSAVPAVAQERAALADRQLGTLSNASPVYASSGGVSTVTINDDAIANRIADRIRRYVNYTIFDDVNISVDRGVATLSGRVTMPYKASDMTRIAGQVKGVLEVNNQLGVLPVSIHDDRIRRALARQIYRDPVFSRYAIHVNPPIHIIVEGGNVTLTGAVNSTLERTKAEMIARQIFGVFGVDNRLRIDS